MLIIGWCWETKHCISYKNKSKFTVPKNLQNNSHNHYNKTRLLLSDSLHGSNMDFTEHELDMKEM